MTDAVVDASAAIKLVVSEVGSDAARSLFRDSILAAPDLLTAEITNILWKKVTHGELSPAQAVEDADILASSGIVLHPMHELLLPALAYACALRHPAYDCFYLALAHELGVPLVTADRRLLARLAGASVPDLPAVRRLIG